MVSATAPGAVLEEMLDDPRAFPPEVRERHHHVREPDAARLLGAEALAGEGVPAQLPHADRIGQERDDRRRSGAQRAWAIENSALSAATTTSQAAMMPVPPPKHAPWTSATVGTGAAVSRRIASAVARDTRRFSAREASRTAPITRGRRLPVEVLPIAPNHHRAEAGLLPERDSAASMASISAPL